MIAGMQPKRGGPENPSDGQPQDDCPFYRNTRKKRDSTVRQYTRYEGGRSQGIPPPGPWPQDKMLPTNSIVDGVSNEEDASRPLGSKDPSESSSSACPTPTHFAQPTNFALVSSKRFSDVRSSFKFPEPPISNAIPATKPSAYGAIDPRPTKGVEQDDRGKPRRSCYAAMRVRQHSPDGEDGGSAGRIQDCTVASGSPVMDRGVDRVWVATVLAGRALRRPSFLRYALHNTNVVRILCANDAKHLRDMGRSSPAQKSRPLTGIDREVFPSHPCKFEESLATQRVGCSTFQFPERRSGLGTWHEKRAGRPIEEATEARMSVSVDEAVEEKPEVTSTWRDEWLFRCSYGHHRLMEAAEKQSLAKLALDHFEANHAGKRRFLVGVDMSGWIVRTSHAYDSPSYAHITSGKNLFILNAVFDWLARYHRFMISLVCVFDGPERPDVKRGKRVNKRPHELEGALKRIIEAFGFEHRQNVAKRYAILIRVCFLMRLQAHGEAEAELAHLNQMGIVDAILTDDSDAFVFRARVVLRDAQEKEDQTQRRVYRAEDIEKKLHLSHAALIFVALCLGGDYSPGIRGCGIKTAMAFVKCGFPDDLLHALDAEPAQQQEDDLQALRAMMKNKLKKADFAAFPDRTALRLYRTPVIWEPDHRAPVEEQEADLSKLARIYEVDIRSKDPLLASTASTLRKRVWPGIVLAALRREAQRLDQCPDPDRFKASSTGILVGGEKVDLAIMGLPDNADGPMEFEVRVDPGPLVRLANLNTALPLTSGMYMDDSGMPFFMSVPFTLMFAAKPRLVRDWQGRP
uniref:XPG-I domain-containing protein n=1 Tax=Mycena chlorophos TaxID=658473 RepID=A0ABQ0M4F7_MYCCL|nr:predicted protein [Mycena chlorophos]